MNENTNDQQSEAPENPNPPTSENRPPSTPFYQKVFPILERVIVEAAKSAGLAAVIIAVAIAGGTTISLLALGLVVILGLIVVIVVSIFGSLVALIVAAIAIVAGILLAVIAGIIAGFFLPLVVTLLLGHSIGTLAIILQIIWILCLTTTMFVDWDDRKFSFG